MAEPKEYCLEEPEMIMVDEPARKPVTTIELDITPEKANELTWEQWGILDRAPKLTHDEERSIISVFVKGKTQEEGYEILGKLKTPQMNALLDQFSEAVKKLKSVNPQTGG